MIVFISGRLARIRGFVGSWMSMIDTVSLPGGWFTVLPVSSNHTFSSLPVISAYARAPPTASIRPPTNAQIGRDLDSAFIVPSIQFWLTPVCQADGSSTSCANNGQPPPRPPQMQRREIPVPDRLLPRRGRTSMSFSRIIMLRAGAMRGE